MLVGLTKFVDFTYCKTCEFYKKDERDEPCNECLSIAVNEGSNIPTKYKKASINKRTHNEI